MARILVIDDSPSVVQKVRTILTEAGHVVETLELFIYLPQAVKENPPDLILLDLSMPALSGANVAALVRRFQKDPIPIVLHSSRPVEEIEAAARDLGAAGYLHKGDTDRQLVTEVERVLRHAKFARN